MVRKFLLLLSCILISWSLPFTAVAADGELYQATVPVASYSSPDYNKAAEAALVQVLAAVSANDKVASLSAVQKALEKPNKFVQSYRYTATNQQLIRNRSVDP